jgi:MFS family permease
VVAEVWQRRRIVLFSLLLTASLAGLTASTVLLPLGLVLLAMWAVAVPAALVDSAPLWLSRRLTRRRRLRSLALGGAAFTLATVVPAACGVLALLVTDWSFAVVNLIDGVVGLLLVPTAGIISLLQFGDLRERLGYGTLPD